MMSAQETCVIIGANQAGVSCAFALRKEGWQGKIFLFDADPTLPYYRPPLSKSVLMGTESMSEHFLKPAHLYEKEKISLQLGKKVTSVNPSKRLIVSDDESTHNYNKLVLATGGRPIIPDIKGIKSAKNVFTVRNANDAEAIHKALDESKERKVAIIGAGYIGLETAASLTKMNAKVTVLERESRVLSRVTAPEMSKFYTQLHKEKGVEILTGKTVISIQAKNGQSEISCSDGSAFFADIIVLGVGIQVNLELAEVAGLKIENGIHVDSACRTSDKEIYAIGDCSNHFNPLYHRFVRLESVQNASDQAKVAAASICGKDVSYNSVPWFWSDQYNVKLQIVGLSEGYTESLIRKEADDKFSIWYFKNERLLAVDSVNDMKAYMIGTKFIKNNLIVDKSKLTDPDVEFKPANLSL